MQMRNFKADVLLCSVGTLSLQAAQQLRGPSQSPPAAWLQVLERQVVTLQAAQTATQGELAASQKRAADLEGQVTSLIGKPPVLRQSALAEAWGPCPAMPSASSTSCGKGTVSAGNTLSPQHLCRLRHSSRPLWCFMLSG